MKYKVGDEVLIKAEIKDDDGHGKKQIKIKGIDGCSPLWIDVYELISADKTYEQGVADSWNLLKKVYDMNCDAIEEIFGVKGGFYDVIRNFTFEDCRDKIEAYERTNEIKVGDEVVHGEGSFQTKFTVTFFESNKVEGFDKNGNTHSFCYPNPYIKKTGKHIDIESLLKEIGE